MDCGILHELSRAQIAEDASWFDKRSKVFLPVHKVRDFQLVSCADVLDSMWDYAVEVLKRAVAAEKEKRRFDYAFLKLLVTYNPRGFD